MTVKNIMAGDRYSGYLQIRDVSLREAKTGNSYLFIKAGDITGDILIKVWSVEKQFADKLVDNTVGGFLEIDGLIADEYQGNVDLISQGGKGLKYLTREEMEEKSNFDILDYMIGSPFGVREMSSYIRDTIQYDIDNIEIKQIVASIYEENKEEFINHPAAVSMHHDYEEGLLFHTYNMLRVAKALSPLYPHINKSLLYGGVILHDMGKIIEYKRINDSGGYEFSTKGSLIGHISIMSAEIEKKGRELDISDEIIMNLQHLVLSHHGKLEWGSPVKPQTPEAILLHYIDNIDSKMEMVRSAMVGVNKGEKSSNRLFGLDNINLYIPNIN